MSARRLDVEQWMSHRLLPEKLRKQVRESEQYNWSVNRGLNDLMLFKNLPEDLQIDIRRHLFNFVEKIPIFAAMDDSILDAIRESLQRKTYFKGSRILVRGRLIDKIVFIAQGTLESIGEDNKVIPLSAGGVCGEELIELCLKHSASNRNGKRISIAAQKMLSKRMVRCLPNVEAFTLQAADLVEVTRLLSWLLIRNPRIQGAIKDVSPHLQRFVINRVKISWGGRKKRLKE